MCRKRDCKKKPHEGTDLILCPACLEVKHQTLHHINPKCHYGETYPWLYLCAECHRELHDLYPWEKIHPEDYLQIAREFLLYKRGEN